jgi:glycosyltransferase involved in cell wall biosynthesis
MAKPTLSVVLPNYNHSKCLPKALQALAARERPPDELIVIDDGSTDNSWEIIQSFASQYPFIRAYKNDRNRGIEYTVGRGLELASGDYFGGAASDDLVLPGFFEKSMALLSKHPEAGLCCTIGDWRELHTGLNWHVGVGMADQPTYLSPDRMMELERRGKLFIAGHTVIVKRSSLLEVGQFPASTKYACDWYTYNLIGFHCGICVVPEVLAVNQIDANTYYLRGRRDKAGDQQVMEAILRLWSQEKWQDAVELMRKCGALYIWGYPMLKTLVRHREYWHYLTPTFLRKNLWHIAKLSLKRMGPAWLVNFYCQLAGYRAKPTKPKAA